MVTARALVSSGMLPSVGIFRRNKYNAFCLADDIMEPYSNYVDALVYEIVKPGTDITELTTTIKSELLGLLAMDIFLDEKWNPLMNAMNRGTNSLYECFFEVAVKPFTLSLKRILIVSS